jgi:tetratricopeptide (TPR) repeat protein
MSNYLAEQYFIEAIELICEWKYADAKKKLEEIVEMEPGYGRAHFKLGWLYYFKFSDFERANYHLRLAIKVSPEFPVSYYTYAYLLNEINHPAAMKIHAAKSLAVRGIDASIIYNELAKSFELNGNYAEAISNYRSALKVSLCNDQVDEIQKNIERVKTKMKTFGGGSFVYEISRE